MVETSSTRILIVDDAPEICRALKRHLEAPYKVVINEAIELAKSYGGTDGHKYVNGVLDKLAAAMRPEEVARPGRARKSITPEEK